MTAQQFFYLVAQMRAAQKAYIENRSPKVLRAAIMAEKEVDAEIERVRQLLES